MKARLGILFMVMVIVLACAGGVAVAADYDWVGQGGQVPTPNNWSDADNWSPSGGPPGSADHAFVDPADSSLCIVDDAGGVTVTDLDLAGDSPTKMRLHVKDGTLEATADFLFSDYGFLDADQDFTADGTGMSGDIWIEVANSTTVDLGAVDVLGSSVSASPTTCTLHLRDNTSGTLTTSTVMIDAEAGNTGRGLKLDGNGTTLHVTGTLTVKSKQDADTKRAKLWVSAGTVNIAAAMGNAVLVVDGGAVSSRQAELDIDDILTAEETRFESGYAAMDVASGKTATGGDVIFEAGAIVTKTGPGTFKSGT